MCDQRVLCACLSYACLCDMYCMLYYLLLRPDRRIQRTMRPEGSQLDQTRASNELGWTRGANELWDWRVLLRYIEVRVVFWEITKLRAYHVMCCVFQFFLRIVGRHRLDCTHQGKSYVLRILEY